MEETPKDRPADQAEPACAPARKPSKRAASAQRVVGGTRMIALIPAFALAICAFALTIATAVEAFTAIGHYVEGGANLNELAIELVEYTDMFLLGVVLYIVALGLVCLFVTDRIPLPKWLEFHDLDDLKERLISVIVVMLGVYFLGVVLSGRSGLDLVWLGVGICLVIAALTFFTSAVFKHRE